MEANLLSERLFARERVYERSRRVLFGMAFLLAFALVVLPAVYGRQKEAARQAIEAGQKAAVMARELEGLSPAVEAATPHIAHQEMLDTERRRSALFLGHVAGLLNTVPTKMALSRVRADIIGGEMTLRGKADAEDFATAQYFVEQAAADESADDALLISTRRNDALAVGGVTFEFIKKVVLRQ